ncbi:ScbA/BarX family gamma-butyrolactone biosynthesis protein [Streptomyces flaveolus]|uniref:ScbA/BarX family gamma-butyrolactone biosynthesis protein n=1 Tax=Streptomyces flaveolus TaxID=67297 RepID=A0ABV3A8R0_9ACTN|nr:ScbA/BarX family gamma-butyrolactone biosynthesis protein [Streptomyces antibioticus]KMS81555.1 gamma-butyrolactone biosynthesis enzyme [Streptomyces regensis]KOG73621.1 gamma-butyrolactone biosynthesis enzyme [Streptomyces antibioticus]
MATPTRQRIVSSRSSASDVKQYAGKVDLTEVLVADWHPVTDRTHAVTVEWPAHHPFYTTTAHRHGLLFFIESVRQALAVASHLGLGVPRGYRMGWERLTCTASPEALVTGPDPSVVRLTITHDDVVRRKSGVCRLTARVQATRNGIPLGTAHIGYTAYPPALYDRLRGARADAKAAFARALPPGPAVEPALVGRTDTRDVTLAPDPSGTSAGPGGTPRRWALRSDTTHRILFDHPHDHIPGMVLLEAVIQAAHADAAPLAAVPVELDTVFHRYVEFDLPCAIVTDDTGTDEPGRQRRRVSGVQDGQTAFTTLITSIVPDQAPPLPHDRRIGTVAG